MSEDGDRILQGLQEVLDIVTGETQPARICTPVDIKAMHKKIVRRYPVILAKLAEND